MIHINKGFIKENIFYKSIILIISSSPHTFIGKFKYTINLIPLFWFKYLLFIFSFLIKNKIFKRLKSFPLILIKYDCKGKLKKITINSINNKNQFSCYKLYNRNKNFLLKPEIESFEVLKGIEQFSFPIIDSVFKYKDWKVISTINKLGFYSVPNKPLPNKNIIKALVSLISKSIKTTYINKTKSYKCLAHGDFTPWNIRENENFDKKILIYDWEYSFSNATIFYDLFYYIFMTSHALKKDIPSNEKVISTFDFFINFILDLNKISINKLLIINELNQTLFILYKRAKYNKDFNFYKWLKLNQNRILSLFQDIYLKSKVIK